MANLSIGDKRLGAVLLERGYVTDESLQKAIGRHSETGGKLSDILVNLGVISEQRIARAIEESIGIPLVVLPRVDVMPEAIEKLSARTAFELSCVPFSIEGNQLRVAFEDPLDAMAIEEIEDATGCFVEPYKGLSKEIQWAMATYYPELELEVPRDLEIDLSQRLGSLAVEQGYASSDQVALAAQEQQRTGGLLGRILVDQEVITEEQLTQLLALQSEIPFEDGFQDEPFDEPLASTLLRLDAVQFQAVPVRDEGDAIVIAVADPRRIPDLEAIVARR